MMPTPMRSQHDCPRAEIVAQGQGQIGAKREIDAMREVDHAEHSENDRESDRDQDI